jgi:hypothetical protein
MLGGGAAARPPPPGPMPGPPAVLLVGGQHAWGEDSRVLPALRGSLGGQRSTAVSDAGVHLPQVGQVDRAIVVVEARGPCCSGRSSGSCATGNVVETLLTCFHNNDCTVRRGPSPHGPSHDPQYQIMHACMHACHSVHPRTPPAAPPFTLSLAVSRYPWAHVFVCRCGLQDQT